MKKILAVLLTIAILSTLAGCIGTQPVEPTDPSTPQDIAVESIVLAAQSTALVVGETTQLTVTVTPENATDKTVIYTSGDVAVATVSETGLVTAVSAGTATITATVGDKTDTVEITVAEPASSDVSVESVEVSAQVSKLNPEQTTQLTVNVLPANATNKAVSFTSDNVAVATVSETGLVTAVGAGTATITVTTQDGAKTDTVVITVEPPVADPLISLAGELSYTVNAGEDLVLPTVTATDYNGTDLTAAIEMEDYDDAKSINLQTNKFNSKIAGQHTIVYFVYSEATGREADLEITVDVVPAAAESFDVSGYTDINALSNYGTFKENFEKGASAILAKRTDSNNASHISGTSDAISGNSLIINFNKTAGHAANQVFMNAFGDVFKRGVKTTYTVEFDYKVISANGNTGDVYLQLGWDGFDGYNLPFVADSTVGKVNHFTAKFPETTVAATGNAWFSFFKLSGSNDECIIAIDNIVVKATETAVTTTVIPTSDQLQAGFTYDWKDTWCGIGNGETNIVNNIENETVKNAILADTEHFGENVMHLINADGHIVAGINDTNMLPGYVLDVEFYFYSVNHGGLHAIMMVGGVGATQTLNVEHLGNNIYKGTFTYIVGSGANGINIYAAGNSSFDIYLGKLSAKLTEKEEEKGKTPNGYQAGDSWEFNSRQWGNEDKGGVGTFAFDGNNDAIANANMGTAPTKFVFTKGNSNMEWAQMGNKFEVGYTYKITAYYYVSEVVNAGRLCYNLDNSVFLDINATTAGYHTYEIEWTATKTVDFFSIYTPGDGFLGTLYLAGIKIELMPFETEKATANGYKEGDSWEFTSRQWGNQDKGGVGTFAFDDNADAIANANMGTAPTKFVFSQTNQNMEWTQMGGKMETGHTYKITMHYYVSEVTQGGRLCYNFDNAEFIGNADVTVGYHAYELEWTATKNVDFFSLYVPDGGFLGTFYLGSIVVELVSVN
ncbi:MAG: hypothetical protein E7461_00805 [Ruminococcaceae bacterium]|nr:hypothetical protein [Oscillospiraceae bacterium]